MPNILYKGKSIIYQVISLPPQPISQIIRSKLLWGWAESNTSDLVASGFSPLQMDGTVQSSTKKVGTNALSYSGGNNSFSSFRINETLRDSVSGSPGGFTISCWARWNSFNFGGPFGMYAAQLLSDQGIATSTDSTGSSNSTLSFFALANNQSILASALPAPTISINTWYHLVYIVAPTTLSLYVNSTLQGTSSPYPLGTNFYDSSPSFRLAGYAGSGSTTQMNGFLDEFYIFAGVLNQDEINWLYNSGNGNTLL
jgi:hypothetical protein